jgi:hypothetical protein
MKKLLAIAVVLLMVPFTAFGLEMLTDDVMEDVTGQAGVTITFLQGDTVINISVDGIAWGDDDGFGSSKVAAHVRLDGKIGIKITIASGQHMTIDVSGVHGIVLGLPDLKIDISVPESIVISSGYGATVTNWGTPAVSSLTLGTLGLNNVQITITTPQYIAIAPH